MTQTERSTINSPESLISNSRASDRNIEIGLAIHQAENPDNDKCNREIGCRGGIGAMMIVQSTFDEQCKGNVYDLKDNIKCGMKMISNGDLWRWRQSMYNMPNHQGWLNRLSTTTKTYVENRCQCVTFARNSLDLPLVEKADDLFPNSRPFIGAGVLFYKNHIGIIINMNAWGIWVKSGNCNNRCYVCTKFYKWGSDKIRGFVK